MKLCEVKTLKIQPVKVIRFARFCDHRGYFAEHYRRSDFANHPDTNFMKGVEFVQIDAKRWKLTTPGSREAASQELCKLLKEMPEQPRNHRVDELITSLDVKVDDSELPQMLTWEQVKEMSDNGVTFGAHTLNHPMLTKIPLEDARKEIAESKRVLEEKIQKAVKYFAYPYGTETDFNEDIKNIVRESGYTCALTFMGGYNDQNSDIFALGRMALYMNKPDLAFALSSFTLEIKTE